jgi:Protein of unknown function (DUF3164)
MKDAQGRLVPITLVKPEHYLEDRLVREMHAASLLQSAALKRFREKAAGDIASFLELLAEKYGAKPGGAKGNLTLSSYDGTLRIQLAVGDQLAFGPELQIAKTLVDECIRGWSAGANENLQAIVNDAFSVDKQGKLNVERILSLRRLDIQDEPWQRAMVAIGDAIRVVRSKEYLRFYQRVKVDEKFQQVPLDLASV